jgi:hypothetical protein
MAGDGRHYLIHGYPVLDKLGQDDFRFSTYQVNPGAERLFEESGFEDGDKVSEATFYALLLDGELYNDARPDGIEISSVPDKILAFAEQEIRPIQKDLTIFARAVYLLDVFEMLMPQFTNVLDALSLASWLCIFRHWDRHSSKSSKAGSGDRPPS